MQSEHVKIHSRNYYDYLNPIDSPLYDYRDLSQLYYSDSSAYTFKTGCHNELKTGLTKYYQDHEASHLRPSLVYLNSKRQERDLLGGLLSNCSQNSFTCFLIFVFITISFSIVILFLLSSLLFTIQLDCKQASTKTCMLIVLSSSFLKLMPKMCNKDGKSSWSYIIKGFILWCHPVIWRKN